MNNLEKLSQIHTLASTAHSIIYMISSLRWETTVSANFAEEIKKICKNITIFCNKASEEYEKKYMEEKKPF